MLHNREARKKLSIDFDGDTLALIQGYREKNAIKSNSDAVNSILKLMLSLSEETRQELAQFCNTQSTQLESPSGKWYSQLTQAQRLEEYSLLIDFLTDGKGVVPDNAYTNMTRTDLRSGYALYPDDWIRIGRTDYAYCDYAFIIEFKNADNLPHFIYFTDQEEFPSESEKQVILKEWCCTAYPELRDIYDEIIQPRYYDRQGKPLNQKEFETLPIPGFFRLPERKKYNSYPYGAMLVRTEQKGTENG